MKLGGYGKFVQLDSTQSERNNTVGAPLWMAPEVIIDSSYDCPVVFFETM